MCEIVTVPSQDNVTHSVLADGRDIWFFALAGHRPEPVADRRPLPERAPGRTQLRFDRTTGQWVVIAALRQERTHKPAADQCPLCPGPTGLTSEIPAADYDVVVFENRFPSLSQQPEFELPDTSAEFGLFTAAPGHGRCEVVCFSSDHNTSFAQLPVAQARLVVAAWQDRTADLMARPGVEQVFCFENRGEEIGVTLTHPHGQIYGYPFLTPRAKVMLEQADAHRKAYGTNLFGALLAAELAEGRRVIATNEHFTAFVPFAARWPVEVHIYPNRFVPNIVALDAAEADALTAIYLDVLKRFDLLYDMPLPYISALHQYTGRDAQREGYFHIELMSVRRAPNKLKYLAGSESAMDAFIGDVSPEDMADRLCQVARG